MANAGEDLLNTLSKAAGGGNVFSADGRFDVTGVLSGVFHTVEFRSNVLPSIQIRTADVSLDSPPSPWTKLLQPTVIFYGPGGETIIAPAGESSPNTGLFVGLVVVAAIFGAGFMLGRVSKK